MESIEIEIKPIELQILQYMNGSFKTNYSCRQIGVAIGKHKNTAHRHCNSLYLNGWLDRTSDGVRFLYSIRREKKKEIQRLFQK